MVKSRILLDVTDSEINIGSSKTVWMFFPATTKNICDLKQLIIQRFNLTKTNFNLSLNGGMLLDDEDIRIFEKGDIIKLHYEEKENISSDDQAAEGQVSNSIENSLRDQHEDKTLSFTEKSDESTSVDSDIELSFNEKSDENTSEDSDNISTPESDPGISANENKKKKTRLPTALLPYPGTRLSKKKTRRASLKRKPYPCTRLSKKISMDNASTSAALSLTVFNKLKIMQKTSPPPHFQMASKAFSSFYTKMKKNDKVTHMPPKSGIWMSPFSGGFFFNDKVNSILEMFPHFTYDEVMQDMLITNSMESTIENILAERLIPSSQSNGDLGEASSSHQPTVSSTSESELAPPSSKKSFSAFVLQESIKSLVKAVVTGQTVPKEFSGDALGKEQKATSGKDYYLNAGVQPHKSTDGQGNNTDPPPYHEIMKGVVFTLSGFINPRRSKIRDLALQMGAKYSEIWDSSCTHLICAFVNTPKYIEAKRENGKIVTDDWITSCHEKRTLLPWKTFTLEAYVLLESSDYDEEETSEVEETSKREETSKEYTIQENYTIKKEEETRENKETDSGLSEIKINVDTAKTVPNSHKYRDSLFQPVKPAMFLKTVQNEMKILKSSLPEGIIVKSFEERMDLYSALIKGPKGTPYEDGLFFFDIQFPATYPYVPPRFHYISYCRNRINPNLYEMGKVCVSLLGTWTGKGSELWSFKTSNLLQVLVSIQGLILVPEPYFNEPGYERLRGTSKGREVSRFYNDMVVRNQVEAMSRLLSNPPELFKEEIMEHFKENSSKIIERFEAWVALSEAEEIEEPSSSTSPKTFKKHKFGYHKQSKKKSHSTPSTSKAFQKEINSGVNTSDNIHIPEYPLLPASRRLITALKKFLASFKNFKSSPKEMPASHFF